MKKIISLLITISIAFVFILTPAFAAGEGKFGQGANSGVTASGSSEAYIFKLSKKANPEEIEKMDGVEAILSEANLYKTNNYKLVESLFCQGLIEQYEKDKVVSLDSLAEEISALQGLSTQNYSSAMLGYSYAESKGINGSGIKIAVIDSGLSENFQSHTQATILTGVNLLVDKDSPERNNVNDTIGHGTMVTSVICGDGYGPATGVSILPLKCFDDRNSSYSSVIEAIGIAITEGCDIINMSFGGADQSTPLAEAIELAMNNGIVVVASSGNITGSAGSSGNDSFYYPAAQEGVIGVGAIDYTKTVSKTSAQNESVDFVAPGIKVQGYSINGTAGAVSSGTSFSAPLVAAVAALALSVNSELSSEDLVQLMAETAEDLGDEGKDNSYGYGLINPALLLATITEDKESIILSYWNENVAFTAYTSSENSKMLAYYSEDGKMNGLEFCTVLNNFLLPADVSSFSLFETESENYTPVTVKRGY